MPTKVICKKTSMPIDFGWKKLFRSIYRGEGKNLERLKSKLARYNHLKITHVYLDQTVNEGETVRLPCKVIIHLNSHFPTKYRLIFLTCMSQNCPHFNTFLTFIANHAQFLYF